MVLFIFPMSRTYEMLLLVFPITWILTDVLVLTAYLIVRRREKAHAR